MPDIDDVDFISATSGAFQRGDVFTRKGTQQDYVEIHMKQSNFPDIHTTSFVIKLGQNLTFEFTNPTSGGIQWT